MDAIENGELTRNAILEFLDKASMALDSPVLRNVMHLMMYNVRVDTSEALLQGLVILAKNERDHIKREIELMMKTPLSTVEAPIDYNEFKEDMKRETSEAESVDLFPELIRMLNRVPNKRTPLERLNSLLNDLVSK